MKEKKEDESTFIKRLKNQKDDFEKDPEQDDGWEDPEQDREKPWVTILTFVGLAVLAGIICFILWQFTHPDKSEEGGNPGSGAVGTSESGGEPDAVSTGQEDVSEDSRPEQTASREEPAEPDQESSPGQKEEQPGQQDAEQSEEENGETDGQEPEKEQEQKPQEGTRAMTFAEQQESVTPKDVVNLRSVPATGDETTIVVQVQNGEVLTRTGINQDTGWSRIDYGDQTLYAVSQYLTTDLGYKPPVQASNPNRVSTISGRIILFSDCDDWITPKEYVNLRTEPSTTEGDSTVSCQLNNGEKAHRTGYSTDSGWSRVEYNGQILYVVTSLMYETEPD